MTLATLLTGNGLAPSRRHGWRLATPLALALAALAASARLQAMVTDAPSPAAAPAAEAEPAAEPQDPIRRVLAATLQDALTGIAVREVVQTFTPFLHQAQEQGIALNPVAPLAAEASETERGFHAVADTLRTVVTARLTQRLAANLQKAGLGEAPAALGSELAESAETQCRRLLLGLCEIHGVLARQDQTS
jgi:hypothetical protein